MATMVLAGLRETGEPSSDAVQRQLERMLASKTFSNAPSLSKFLRFGVEAALAGAKGLNEYTIAVDVFERDSSFDPRVDPIVRVQARRLRSKLAQYYADEGADDRIEIQLPLRRYMPVFRPKQSSRHRSSHSQGLAPDSCVPGSIAVLPLVNLSPGKQAEQFTEGVNREIVHSLVNENDWRIVSTTAHQCAEMRGSNVQLVLSGTLRRAKRMLRVSIELVKAPDGTVLWSRMFDFEMDAMISTQEKIARAICDGLRLHLSVLGGA